MPNNYGISRNERIYLASETTFGTIATVTGTSYCRAIEADLQAVVANYPRPDKTGTRSQVIGLLGRQSATWSLSQSLAGSGTAGTVPDCAPILRALFGVPGAGGAGEVITGATSVLYKFLPANDALVIPSFSMYSYRTPSTLAQRVIQGGVVGETTFTLGQNIATWSASGTGIWCVDSDNIAAQVAGTTPWPTGFQTSGPGDTEGGLTTVAAEPATPVAHGIPTVGFTGSAVFDGNTIAEIQTATIRVRTGGQVANDTFGSYYPVLAEGGTREVSVAFTIYDNDGTGLKNIKAKAEAQVGITIVLTLGTVAGNIWAFTLNNVQVQVPKYDDSRNRYMCAFPDSMAHSDSISVTNELQLLIT